MKLLFELSQHFDLFRFQFKFIYFYPIEGHSKSHMRRKPVLYIHPFSPPSRAVLLTGAAIGIKFDIKFIDLMAFEQKNPEYIKVSFEFSRTKYFQLQN